MKLWEVVKELTEDPTKVFENNSDDYNERLWSDDGFPNYSIKFRGKDMEDGSFSENAELGSNGWQLVLKPVPWQEGVQAWVDGKTVTVSTPFGFESIEAKKSRGSSITEYEITKGIWYVED